MKARKLDKGFKDKDKNYPDKLWVFDNGDSCELRGNKVTFRYPSWNYKETFDVDEIYPEILAILRKQDYRVLDNDRNRGVSHYDRNAMEYIDTVNVNYEDDETGYRTGDIVDGVYAEREDIKCSNDGYEEPFYTGYEKSYVGFYTSKKPERYTGHWREK